MPELIALVLLVVLLLALILCIAAVLSAAVVFLSAIDFLKKVFNKTGSLKEVKHLEGSLQAVGGNLKKSRKHGQQLSTRLIMFGKQEIHKEKID